MLDLLKELFSNKINETANLFTFSFLITDVKQINLLQEVEIDNILNEKRNPVSDTELQVGQTYIFDLAWTSLRRHNFYTTCSDFVKFNNKDKSEEFYILEIDCTERDIDNFFIKNYNDLILIKDFIIKISNDNIQEKYLIYFENRYLKIPNLLSSNSISKIKYVLEKDLLENFFNDYEKSSNEIKVIFKSELINFLDDITEGERLTFLYCNFSDFYKRCIIGYEYYIKDFSYIKVKTELDNAVLDFSKNIRTVVNDSQNKLIIIPAAVVLAFTTFEIKEPFNTKNIFVLASSVLFAYMMDSFVNNQDSALKIIKTNVINYKTLFFNKNKSKTENLNGMILDSFVKADDELQRQENWMLGIKIINWIIPVLLLVYLLTLIYNLRS
ncbi:hypothetical protein [Chryseobacterium viscerum]|uniref:Uncharacterized protein n=1 Tax=Chryseobacterium viscerum TaxID=1037377 RepID=A0A316WC66_9FLAO|nr:hypothetical protein [Chryseobacterium viscerum]PWN57913.1 hypothetical protein C1634_025510 [Chryseobacterium viscerum]